MVLIQDTENKEELHAKLISDLFSNHDSATLQVLLEEVKNNSISERKQCEITYKGVGDSP